MRIVLGLGNPGSRYEATRHNLGFRVVELIARRYGSRFTSAGPCPALAWIASVAISGESALLAKPRTFMNRSGRAAIALLEAHGTSPSDLLVVQDDADLELGRIRVRPAGRAGGHNGVQSLIDVLGTDCFGRIKLGVRGPERARRELSDYVLEDFADDERPIAEALVGLAAEAVESVITRGFEITMNAFNGRWVPGLPVPPSG